MEAAFQKPIILKLASEFASSASVASVVRRIERFLLRGLVKRHEAAVA